MPALNIAEIQTNKENVKVFKTAYTDKLSNYRNDYSDYSFYRFDNEIFAWNLYILKSQKIFYMRLGNPPYTDYKQQTDTSYRRLNLRNLYNFSP